MKKQKPLFIKVWSDTLKDGGKEFSKKMERLFWKRDIKKQLKNEVNQCENQ